MAHAGEEGHFIGFKLHAGTTAVAQTAARQLTRNIVTSYVQASWQILNQRNERLAVGFTGGSPSKHVEQFTA